MTHDQAEALTMSDRIAVMMDGDLLQLGTPDEVYKYPNDIRVAEFIGSPKMNILPGVVDPNGQVTCLGFVLDQSLEGTAQRPEQGPVSVGLRPEHLALRPDDTEGCFAGKLTYKENLGSDVFLHLETEGLEQRVVLRVKPHEANLVKLGQNIFYGAEPGKMILFGADGKRVGFSAQQSDGKPD